MILCSVLQSNNSVHFIGCLLFLLYFYAVKVFFEPSGSLRKGVLIKEGGLIEEREELVLNKT